MTAVKKVNKRISKTFSDIKCFRHKTTEIIRNITEHSTTESVKNAASPNIYETEKEITSNLLFIKSVLNNFTNLSIKYFVIRLRKNMR